MSNKAEFLFRKTLVEPLGSTIYEFPYHYASKAWPTILEERNDPYETISISIGNTAGSNKKAHIARLTDLFDDAVKHVGMAHIRSDSLVTVRVFKNTTNKSGQQMQLLMQPRTFEFNTVVGMTESSKIMLSHDPLMLDCVVVVDKRIQKGPMPLRELRNAYRAAQLEFIESERNRLGSSDSLRTVDLRNAPVTIYLVAKGTVPPQIQQQQQPVQQSQQNQWRTQQPMQQPMQQYEDQGMPIHAPLAEESYSSGLKSAVPSGNGQMYPMTSHTSPMYSPAAAGQGVAVPVQQNTYQQPAQGAEQRRKDQPPAPLLSPGISQTSMYYEMGQYGPATSQQNSAALPPDFFTSA